MFFNNLKVCSHWKSLILGIVIIRKQSSVFYSVSFHVLLYLVSAFMYCILVLFVVTPGIKPFLLTHLILSSQVQFCFVLFRFFSVTYFVSAVLCIEWNIGLSYTWAFIPWACVRGLHINLFMLVWASSASEMVLACSEPWLRFHLSMGLSGGVQSILGFPYAHLAMAVSSRLTCWHFFFFKFLIFFWNL